MHYVPEVEAVEQIEDTAEQDELRDILSGGGS